MKKDSKIKKNYWQAYNYPENKKIGDQLIVGEREQISELTDMSYDYVKKVFQGTRHNDDIVKAAKILIDCRKKAAKIFKK